MYMHEYNLKITWLNVHDWVNGYVWMLRLNIYAYEDVCVVDFSLWPLLLKLLFIIPLWLLSKYGYGFTVYMLVS